MTYTFFCSGTIRANTYAAYYPERVGNFVLDAVVPHNVVSYIHGERLSNNADSLDCLLQSTDTNSRIESSHVPRRCVLSK